MTANEHSPHNDSHGLIMVANAEPYQHVYDSDGTIRSEQVSGGVTTGLDPLMQDAGGTWIGWGRGDADFAPEALDTYDSENEVYTVQIPPDAAEDGQYTLRRIQLDEKEQDEFYYGFSNKVLWPGIHGFNGRSTLPDHISYEDRFWDTYQAVNNTYADAVIETATEHPDQPVILHDYQLTMVPEYIADEVDNPVGMFWHINVPPVEDWDMIPHNETVFDSLMQTDLFQVHTDGYVQNILDIADEYYGGDAVDREHQTVTVDGHTTTVSANPLGITPGTFQNQVGNAADTDDDHITIMGLARSDPIKGIPEGLEGVQNYLATHPEQADSLTVTYKMTPSRTDIDAYQDVVDRAEHRTAIINTVTEYISRQFGDTEHAPAELVQSYMEQDELRDLFQDADVALVNSIVDGMNLVAKEYVDAKQTGGRPGSMVLGEGAGVAEAYSAYIPDELIVNGRDPAAVADGLEYAIEMEQGDKAAMIDTLYEKEVSTQTVNTWLDTMQRELSVAAARNTLQKQHY